MTAVISPKISKWPFFLGDALLLALAWFIHTNSRDPFGTAQVLAYVGCVAIGAWISIIPFLKDYQTEVKFGEADKLVSATTQIRNVEQLSAQIGQATSQWQSIRDAADKTAASAQAISEKMSSEVRAFNEFIEKTNDGEKATLRLEIDKLRRGEVESLQVIVRLMDHVFALNQAAQRAKQPGVPEQINKFQSVCIDAIRRIGLSPFIAQPSEPFDPQKHQLLEGEKAAVSEGALVAATVASGFTFQGRLVRPALVQLESQRPPAAQESTSPPPEPAPSAPDPKKQEDLL